jgi:hypothetical protein
VSRKLKETKQSPKLQNYKKRKKDKISRPTIKKNKLGPRAKKEPKKIQTDFKIQNSNLEPKNFKSDLQTFKEFQFSNNCPSEACQRAKVQASLLVL